MKKPNHALRQTLARELRLLRATVVNLKRVRKTVHAGNIDQIVATPIGGMTRGALLTMIERAHAQSVKQVCAARRPLLADLPAPPPPVFVPGARTHGLLQ